MTSFGLLRVLYEVIMVPCSVPLREAAMFTDALHFRFGHLAAVSFVSVSRSDLSNMTRSRSIVTP